MKLFFALLMLFAAGLPASAAMAATFAAKADIIGKTGRYTVKKGDTYYSIARRYDIGVVALLAANSDIDPETAGPGTVLRLPTAFILPDPQGKGIVINLAELRLYYFPGDGTVMTSPLGTGKDEWETLTGTTHIARKRENPVWVVPESIRAEEPDLPAQVGPGPDNPLGAYALSLGWPSYAIHGTSHPNSIGTRASHGCIRMYPEDIKALFHAVETGLPVTVIDKFFRLGWDEDKLIAIVYPTQAQTLTLARLEKTDPANFAELYAALRWEQSQNGVTVDWDAVRDAAYRHDGLPSVIGQRSDLY